MPYTGVTRDLNGPGTPEATWAAAELPGRLPTVDPASLRPAPPGRVVVVAPHPDDETFGVGGTMVLLAALAAPVVVVAVTDGEASHPGRADELRRIRLAERAEALRRLGVADAEVHRLGLPDGDVGATAVAARLRPLLSADDLVLTPWQHDGHPDHDACGAAAAALVQPDRLWFYLIWAWHWATPAELPWERAERVPLGAAATAAKRAAARAYASQLEGDTPILPPATLARLLRADEVLLRGPR
ncbi:hypothetical protein BL253_18940 [Pseudofrankia asymbiotica]|uniref:GlcNAc-PI de-N-acetylase n=2 Tax=Pseudofrankia asymbiotica TaxID=1834516 RepID=A0A1V2I8M3_9ACTN|nr:hypothetical protein BL253_18940 [Pseudofrankia asymbiotica]